MCLIAPLTVVALHMLQLLVMDLSKRPTPAAGRRPPAAGRRKSVGTLRASQWADFVMRAGIIGGMAVTLFGVWDFRRREFD